MNCDDAVLQTKNKTNKKDWMLMKKLEDFYFLMQFHDPKNREMLVLYFFNRFQEKKETLKI